MRLLVSIFARRTDPAATLAARARLPPHPSYPTCPTCSTCSTCPVWGHEQVARAMWHPAAAIPPKMLKVSTVSKVSKGLTFGVSQNAPLSEHFRPLPPRPRAQPRHNAPQYHCQHGLCTFIHQIRRLHKYSRFCTKIGMWNLLIWWPSTRAIWGRPRELGTRA